MHICIHCDYHVLITKNSAAKDVWYNHFCKVTQREKGIDPVTGKDCFKGKSSNGEEYFTEEEFINCNFVNKNGDCQWFSEKNQKSHTV